MHKLLAVLFILIFATQAGADHFNTRNIKQLCAEDNAFESRCYTYIAAYKDFLGFLVTATEDDRARLSCLFDLETQRIAERLANQQPGGSWQIARWIIDEFCN